ncbi:MAG: DNA gyrase C-terminal beta-propeller domain-containing protein, partial [Chloroflexota bacterium]
LSNFISPRQEEESAYLLPVADFDPSKFLVVVTRRGKVKRMRLGIFARVNRLGVKAMGIGKGDEIVSAQIAKEEDDLIIVNKQGKAIRFAVGTIRAQSRAGGGVRGMKLDPEDQVVASAVAHPDRHLLLLTDLGYGKFLAIPVIPQQHRGGKGVKVITLNPKNGNLVAAATVSDPSASQQKILILSQRGQAFPHWIKDISVQKRNRRGMQIAKLDAPDKVIGLTVMDPEG